MLAIMSRDRQFERGIANQEKNIVCGRVRHAHLGRITPPKLQRLHLILLVQVCHHQTYD
jgi:hypothetical protein